MSPRSTHATIYQVAKEAGVAISTVSKVLTNKAGVSAETRARVRQAVELLGYTPNLAARGLSYGRTGIVAAIYAFPPRLLFTDPYLLQNLMGIKEALDEAEFTLLLCTGREHDPTSSFDRLLRSRYFDGAIILESTEIREFPLHQKLDEQGKSWVVMGFPGQIEACSAVYVDDYTGGQEVARHFLALGHRSFAVVSADPRPSGVDERVRGFMDVLRQNNIQVDPDLIYHGEFTVESGYQTARSLLYRPNRPSAIFAVNDRIALGIMKWAYEQGMRVPDDFSIVGYDDTNEALVAVPGLTTVRQPGVEVGRAAAKMVLRLIAGEPGPQQEVLPAEMVIRGTTRQAFIS